MDYDQLVAGKSTVGSIKYRINYDLIDAAGIIAEAEDDIFTELRVREMVKITAISVSEDDTAVTMPTDWLAPLAGRLRGFGELQFRTADQLDRFRAYEDDDLQLVEGVPQTLYPIGSSFEFEVRSDDD